MGRMDETGARLAGAARHGQSVALPDPRRAHPEQLLREIDAVSQSPIVEALLAAGNTMLVVLDERRQIVAWNGRGVRPDRRSNVLGLRLGEALRCANAVAASDCGAARACAGCGALGAILGCRRERRPVDGECLLRSCVGTALDFDVRASPLAIGGSEFVVVSLRDVSSEKRRQALEQVFFHDVLNTVTGLRGWSELLRIANGSLPGAPERIDRLTRQLERDIRDHRALVLAEEGALVPRRERVSAAALLIEVEDVFATHVAARDRRLEREVVHDVELETDPALVLRVLVNMVRNALEATEPGGTVRVRCERHAAPPARAKTAGAPDAARFSVHNEGVMPLDVQARVFQRAFSTKAQHGRGFGTYGMKLLGESCLGGSVGFASEPERGTVFHLDLPLVPGRSPLSQS